ncbi:MAG: hypothetical protein L6266_01200 [Nanoarchaeota archaeon]|nr:hypothetical protein [Nanoarchaeota archaeon]
MNGVLSLKERKRMGHIDAYESYIPESSLLIGKTAGEVLLGDEDKIIIDHIHNSPNGLTTRQPVNYNTVFDGGMSIKLFGDWENICVFTEKYGLP